jgi:hypothetical protein
MAIFHSDMHQITTGQRKKSRFFKQQKGVMRNKTLGIVVIFTQKRNQHHTRDADFKQEKIEEQVWSTNNNCNHQ